MRHADSKIKHASRNDAVEFVLVLAAVLCVVTTVLYGFAAAFQGGLTPGP